MYEFKHLNYLPITPVLFLSLLLPARPIVPSLYSPLFSNANASQIQDKQPQKLSFLFPRMYNFYIQKQI